MKHRIGLSVLAAGLLLAQPAPDPAATARKALDLLLAGDYSNMFQMFAPSLQSDISQENLAKLAATQIKPLGAVEKISDPTVRKAGSNTVVIIPIKFASQNVNFQVGVNSTGQLYAMVLLPGEVAWQHPPYAKPESFQERQVSIGTAPWVLSGTLTVPAGPGPFAGIVLVHGQGPSDRDETVFGTKIFKDLAEGLASRGIAVLRYEKRTRQYAARMSGVGNYTVKEEIVDDAVAAAAAMRAQKEIDPKRVYVLGYDRGGYVAPRIAQADGKLAGLIILAGSVRPPEDLLMEQAESQGMAADRLTQLKALVARIKALEPGDTDLPPIMGMPVAYLLDLKGYDPAAMAKEITIPILILQGERDYQVSTKEFALWKSELGGRKDVTYHSFPTLNHLFVAGEGKSTEAEYRKPGHVAAEVIDEIAKWVK